MNQVLLAPPMGEVSLTPPNAADQRLVGGELGDWRLVQHLADGQWAEVYRARPREQGNDERADYVVKVLKPNLRKDPVAVGMLRREAYVGAAVSSPHLLPVLSAELDQPPGYLVMPYLEGAGLNVWLQNAWSANSRGLGTPRALWLARQIATGLGPLHQQGWIHGDVNPSNVIVSPRGHATLIDLGLSQRITPTTLDPHQPLAGTISHTAPELLARTAPRGAYCDVYSLGVTLFQMLTGRMPFAEGNASEVAAAHRRHRPYEARRLVPQLPSELSRLLKRMLAKEPFRRPTLDELVDALIKLEIETLQERTALGL